MFCCYTGRLLSAEPTQARPRPLLPVPDSREGAEVSLARGRRGPGCAPGSLRDGQSCSPATTTARIYAHLYDDELDVVAAALNGLRSPNTQGR